MGFSGISIWQLLILLAIVILVFGTKRLNTIGTDIGKAIKGFRSAMHDDHHDKTQQGAQDASADAAVSSDNARDTETGSQHGSSSDNKHEP